VARDSEGPGPESGSSERWNVSSKPEKESVVRTELIDRQLLQAGWSTSNGTLVEEFPVKPEPESPPADDQFADYVLLGRDGRILAVIEAKRSTRDALAGKRQAADYADSYVARAVKTRSFFLRMVTTYCSGTEIATHLGR
jgi:type I site-specific restriction endonuclease